LKSDLRALLPGDVKWQWSTVDKTAKPDGSWFHDIFTYLIVELKSEQGLNGDPFLQGLLTYGKILAQSTYFPYIPLSNLPIILLTIAGDRLVLSTAIFTDKIYADELLSITLRFGSHKSNNVFRVARVFMAIKESMRLLRGLYRGLRPSSHSPQQTTALWPAPTVPPSELKPIPKLEFFAKVNRANGKQLLRIDEENECHAMYLARMQIGTSTRAEASTQEVFVKFAPTYNEDAHRLLADHDPPLAPALHFCARVIGDMYMVIMEYIPESRGRSVHSFNFKDASPLPKDLPQVIERDVSEALRLLHGKRWVFGDLREPNLLYLPGGGRVMLVDFDDVGLDGEARYSACLNLNAGFCPGAQRGQIMKMEHDYENLKLLLGGLELSFPEMKPDNKCEGEDGQEPDALAVNV